MELSKKRIEILTDALNLILIYYMDAYRKILKSLKITSCSKIENQVSIKSVILFLFELLYSIL